MSDANPFEGLCLTTQKLLVYRRILNARMLIASVLTIISVTADSPS